MNKKQRQYLRGLAHHLQPLAMIGQQGLTPTLIKAVNEVLSDHELVKVKIQTTATVDRSEAADELAKRCSAHLIQIIGKVIILYRPNSKRPADKRIILPK
ncbi:MAG: ribosome assembly RNA-binding protein YhbY [Thermodesulfobacteriota bacterium]